MDINKTAIEIIDFFRPDNCKKCLFVSNLIKSDTVTDSDTGSLSETKRDFPKLSETNKDDVTIDFKLQKEIEEKFSKFGLIYEVNIIDSLSISKSSGGENVVAFVRFYSERDAATARKQSIGRLFINGARPRVAFSTRENPDLPPVLYLAKCYELANYYLGFNGWSVKILCMTDESSSNVSGGENEASDESSVCYRCVVQLRLIKHDLHAEGIALSTQQYSVKEPSSKGIAICKAKKNAHNDAVRDAFKKVLIVRMPDDRVFVEINTTVEELQHYDEDLDKKHMIQVSELTVDPKSDSSSDDDEILAVKSDEQIDDSDEVNKLILQELAEENF